ncbi:hypothetical protein B0H19DRAFT_1262945 [Mycena capillaripes]|nr:hypothetical protein B0H19DRAFT_1262945 [Mycena capillaripes]
MPSHRRAPPYIVHTAVHAFVVAHLLRVVDGTAPTSCTPLCTYSCNLCDAVGVPHASDVAAHLPYLVHVAAHPKMKLKKLMLP